MPIQPLFLVANGILDGFNLDGDHRQDFHRDPVKLVEAAPNACLCQTLINITYGLGKKKTQDIRNALFIVPPEGVIYFT